MARDLEREARAAEEPVVGGLPDLPGMLAVTRLSPRLAVHLRGLADELLVNDFPGATLTRAERELVATAVSAGNDCFYCMDSHGAFASELLARAKVPGIRVIVDGAKTGGDDGQSSKMRALLPLARIVRRRARDVTVADVERARIAGASDGDVQLVVLLAAAFSMYNRMVDGLRARTPPNEDAYRTRAQEIAEHGYSDVRAKPEP